MDRFTKCRQSPTLDSVDRIASGYDLRAYELLIPRPHGDSRRLDSGVALKRWNDLSVTERAQVGGYIQGLVRGRRSTNPCRTVAAQDLFTYPLSADGGSALNELAIFLKGWSRLSAEEQAQLTGYVEGLIASRPRRQEDVLG